MDCAQIRSQEHKFKNTLNQYNHISTRTTTTILTVTTDNGKMTIKMLIRLKICV